MEKVSNSRPVLCALCVWKVVGTKVKTKLSCCAFNHTKYGFMEKFKQNTGKTIGYLLMYLLFGISIGFFGPTVEDFACFTGTPVSKVTWAFFAQTLFMVVGIFVSGMSTRWFSPDFILVLSTCSLPLLLLVCSFARWLELLTFLMALMGLMMGMIDCLANLQLVKLYGAMAGPFLQCLHFCYGVGAFITPIVMEPFLMDTLNCNTEPETALGNQSTMMGNYTRNTTTQAPLLTDVERYTKVFQALWVMALLQVPAVFYIICIFSSNGLTVGAVPQKTSVNPEKNPILAEKKQHEPDERIEQVESENRNMVSYWTGSLIVVAILACIMVFIYDGLQGLMNELISVFTDKKVPGKERTSAINAAFWAAYSIGRLLSVGGAIIFTPQFMLLLNIIGCQIGSIILLLCTHNNPHYDLYTIIAVGTVTLGLAMSSITPTIITMTEAFVNMSGLLMSIIIGGAAAGEMLLPLLESQIVEQDPDSFVFMIITAVGITWLLYFMLWFVGKQTDKFIATNKTPSFALKSRQNSDYLAETDLELPETTEYIPTDTEDNDERGSDDHKKRNSSDTVVSIENESVH